MQLRMIFNFKRTEIPEIELPEGFELRSVAESEIKEWGEVLHPACGFSVKDSEYMKIYGPRVLPGGMMGVFEKSSGRLVATASAQYDEVGVEGGLGWVMALPEMRGKKLGAAVSVAAMKFSRDYGHDKMCLCTDDERVPALRMYLNLGWRPYLFDADMPDRWRKICEVLGIDPKTLEDYSFNEDGSIKVNYSL